MTQLTVVVDGVCYSIKKRLTPAAVASRTRLFDSYIVYREARALRVFVAVTYRRSFFGRKRFVPSRHPKRETADNAGSQLCVGVIHDSSFVQIFKFIVDEVRAKWSEKQELW